MYAVPDQAGRIAVVTGANSGTGKEAAARLADAGARVVLAVRSPERGDAARRELLARVPGADLEVRRLDLADLASVREFSEGLLADGRPLDLLVNNAGVMAVPDRTLTVDGFELQMASNALGPLALTVRLLPLLLATPGARVATMSSGAAYLGRIDPAHLAVPRRYSPLRAYGASKLADLLLTRHLARVAEERGWTLRSTAAHPGLTRTNLQANGPALGRETRNASSRGSSSGCSRCRRSPPAPSRCSSPPPTPPRSTAATGDRVGASGWWGRPSRRGSRRAPVTPTSRRGSGGRPRS
jgi:NAD(P)-dependent dehydrogenase (short-subunit alcohol dehydrogenase family)